MKVSLICITAREAPGLGRLLDSLTSQTFPAQDFELVYGDRLWESRENEVKALASEYQLNFTYVRDTPTQPGPCPAGARNACVSASKGEWIISIDDLTFLQPDTIERHWNLYNSGFDAVAGSYLSSSGDDEFVMDDTRVTNEGGVMSPTDLTIWTSWWGLHTAFSRKAYLTINGYDETFDGVYGMEDIDFGHRLKMAGCTMAWEPSILVLCDKGPSHKDTHSTLLKEGAPTSWARGGLKWRNDKLIDYCRAMNVVRGKRRIT